MAKKCLILLFLLLLPVMSYSLPLNETSVSIRGDNFQCLSYSFKQSLQWSCSHREHSPPAVSRLNMLAQDAMKAAEIRYQAEELLNKADSAFDQDDYLQAEQAYRQALTVAPQLSRAWLKLAQFYTDLNREKDALQILHNALDKLPEDADLWFQAGLTQVRQRLFGEALTSLAKAALLAPEKPHYSYVYGIALNSQQRTDEALEVLHQAHLRHPDNHELLHALIAVNRDNHHYRIALKYAEKLAVLEPGNPELQDLLLQISESIKSSENQGNQ